MADDDHARIGFTDMFQDETDVSAAQFLCNNVAYFRSLRVTVFLVLTYNEEIYYYQDFANANRKLTIKQKFTRAYQPQTNGKAERCNQSDLRK